MNPSTNHEPDQEEAKPRPGGGLGALLLGLTGLACAIVAVLAGILPGTLPTLDAAIARSGVPASWFFVLAAVFLGQLVIALGTRSHARASLAALTDGRRLDTFSDSVREIHGVLDQVRQGQTTTERMLLGVQEAVQATRQESKNSGQKDAMFRMAASLDQLGAAIDRRLRDTIGQLHEWLHEIGSSLESGSSALTERVEQTIANLSDRLSQEVSEALRTIESPSYGDSAWSAEGLQLSQDREPEHELEDGTMSLEVEHEPSVAEAHVDLGLLDTLEDVEPLPEYAQRDTAGQPAPRRLELSPEVQHQIALLLESNSRAAQAATPDAPAAPAALGHEEAEPSRSVPDLPWTARRADAPAGPHAGEPSARPPQEPPQPLPPLPPLPPQQPKARQAPRQQPPSAASLAEELDRNPGLQDIPPR